MLSLRLARVNLFEMGLHALIRIGKEKQSPQAEAELAAFFHLRRLGFTVVARNWKSGRAPGTVELVAWEGGTLCFVKVSPRASRVGSTPQSAVPGGGRTGQVLHTLARHYLKDVEREDIPTRFDLLLVDFKQQLESPARFGSRRSKPEIEYLRGAF